MISLQRLKLPVPTFRHSISFIIAVLVAPALSAEPSLPVQARQSLRRAITFYHDKVASHGGYVYAYSADLAKREGEGKTGPDTVWVQPPGTPAVGLALVVAWERTKEPAAVAAARDAGGCLIQGQLRSGGWTDRIEFDPDLRKKFAYRVDPPANKKRQFNVSTFDDDKTQSALRFLMRLDQALDFKDERIHEAAAFALDSILRVQFPNGGWAQGFENRPDPARHPVLKASYPDEWPRQYPGGDYWWLYTFNDNNISRATDTLLLAEQIYHEPKYRVAALRAGDFILLAQMPDPQPAWAQQYDFQMHPAWARKFEPPAISGGESQQLIATLLDLFQATGDRKFLKPVPSAIAYLKKSTLPDGRLARFYELRTNRPLYMTAKYELTHDDADVPKHYAFKISSNLDKLQQRYDSLRQLTAEQLDQRRHPPRSPRLTPELENAVRSVIKSQDDRGAWVEDGKLRYHGDEDDTHRVIRSETFIRNLETLSSYLAAVGDKPAQ